MRSSRASPAPPPISAWSRRLPAALRLIEEDGACAGPSSARPSGEVVIHAARGTVLASGGFPHDAARRRALYRIRRPARSTGPPPAFGDTATGCAWARRWAAPGHLRRRSPPPGARLARSLADGTTGHFPHLIERAKPGIIAVLRDGRRFVNEADGYHDYIRACCRDAAGRAPVSWLVCDPASSAATA